jgi:hypothetical protein
MLASVGVSAAAVPSLPNVQLPKVVTPSPLSLPKPTLPAPTLPKLPAGGAAGGVGSEQPSGSGSAPGGLAAPSIITGPAVGEAAPPPSSSGAAPSSGSAPAQPSNAERARQAQQRRRAAAHERHFRATVKRLSGCLVAARPFERRVLVMRVGLQRRPARSLDAVADRLHVSKRRVSSAERSGVRRIRKARATGACSALVSDAVAGTSGHVGPAITGTAVTLVASDTQVAGNPLLPVGDLAANGVLAARVSSRLGGGSQALKHAAVGPVGGSGDDGGAATALWIAALVLALTGVAITVRHRRRLRGAGDGPPPPPWAS